MEQQKKTVVKIGAVRAGLKAKRKPSQMELLMGGIKRKGAAGGSAPRALGAKKAKTAGTAAGAAKPEAKAVTKAAAPKPAGLGLVAYSDDSDSDSDSD